MRVVMQIEVHLEENISRVRDLICWMYTHKGGHYKQAWKHVTYNSYWLEILHLSAKYVLSSSSLSCSHNESQLRRVNIQRDTACWSWSKSMNWSINYRDTHALDVRISQIETVTNVINWSQSTRKGCTFRVWWKHLDGTLHTILEMRNINYRIRMLWKHVYDRSTRWLMQ